MVAFGAGVRDPIRNRTSEDRADEGADQRWQASM